MTNSNKNLNQVLSQLGRRMIDIGYVNLSQMQQAAMATTRTKQPLIEILQEITGRPVPLELISQYAKQHPFIIKTLYGVEFADSETIEAEEVFRLMNQLLPLSFCRSHQVLPIAKPNPTFLKVVIVEPNNAKIKQELEAFLASQNIKVEYHGIYQEEYQELINQYNRKNKFSQDIEIEPQKALEETIINIGERIDEILDADIEEELPSLQRKLSSEESAIAELVETILQEAIEKKATQIEIYPTNNSVIVQFEEDGIFHPRAEGLLSLDLLTGIIANLKSLAALEENNQPVSKTQQGRLRFRFNIRPVEFWLTISPEKKISLRLLNQNSSLNLAELVNEPISRQNIQNLLNKPSGLIVVTGTNRLSIINTLYSLLSERNQTKVKIITVEEPVERIIPGLTQLEVERNRSSNHASLLKAFPSQELDIIMVDDVSDANTTKIVLDLVIKGHLVLVGIPGRDCAEGITQLLSQDISPLILAERLLGIVHHRYLRRICAVCRLSHTPTSQQRALFGGNSNDRTAFYKANTLSKEGIEQAQSKGRLCRSCNGLGYRGLLDTYEVLTVTPSLKQVIAQKPNPQLLANAIKEENLKSSISYALDLVSQGLTTLDEIERVFADKVQDHSSQLNSSPKSNPSTSLVSQRIENIENLVMGLLHELQQLKLAVIQSPGESENIAKNPNSIPPDLDPSKQTIASGSAFYEELIDPGEWDELRNELNIDQDTIAVDFPDTDEPNPSRRSLPDPW